jgi:hypothetical protein
LGFQQISIIDDDLGRTGSGLVERPGFQRLVSEVLSEEVGAVFCLEAHAEVLCTFRIVL